MKPGFDDIGRRLGSDKSSLTHDYLSTYERLFRQLAEPIRTLIEIGDDAQAGKLWAECLPDALIVVIYSTSKAHQLGIVAAADSGGIIYEVGDWNDDAFVRRLHARYRPDVVIDDGTHYAHDQQAWFRALFEIVVPFGLHIVEDMQTNFAPASAFYNPTGVPPIYATAVEIGSRLNEGMASSADSDDALVASVAFHRKLCVFERSDRLLLQLADAHVVASHVEELDNGGAYHRQPPVVVGEPPWVTDYIRDHLAEPIVVPPPGLICTINDALVRQPGFVFAGGHIVANSVINLIGDPELQHWMPVTPGRYGDYLADRAAFIPAAVIAETTVCLVQNADQNYGHWLIEGLPRLELVRQRYDLGALRFLVGDHGDAARRWQVDSLSYYGVAEEQLVFLGTAPLEFRELIYVGPLTEQPIVKAPMVLRALRRFATGAGDAEHCPSGAERVYVSRNKWGRRSLLNEADILTVVAEYGFEVVYPEMMTFQDQVATFGNARIVVGSLGGSLTNIAFAPDGLSLIALTTQFMNDDFYWDMIDHKAGRYYSLHGPAKDPADGMQSDFTIDVDLFRRTLEEVLAT